MPKKLPPGEAAARHIARNKAKNEKRKADLIAHKLANGITSKTPEQKKERMREYIRAKRAAEKALRPPKIVLTAEENRLHANEKQRLAYARKIAKDGRVPKPITARKQQVSTKPIKTMQKAIRQSPPATSSSFHKADLFRQPKIKIANNSIHDKIAITIKPGFVVYAKPGSDIEQVRAKYTNR